MCIRDRLHIPLVEFRVKGKSYLGTTAQAKQAADAALQDASKKLVRKAQLAVEGCRMNYKVLQDLIKSDLFVSWTLDLFSKKDLNPSYEALNQAEMALHQLEQAIKAKNYRQIQPLAKKVETQSNAALKKYRGAIAGLSGAADTSVTTLEWTKTISFAVVGLYATLVTGGTITAAGGTAGATAMSQTAQLGIPALISMIESGADEGGKALAGDKRQTKGTVIANIMTAGLSSVAVDKFFGSPKVKQYIGKMAFDMNGMLNADHLGLRLANGTFKDLLETYMNGAGKGMTQQAIIQAVKAKNGEATTQDVAKGIVGGSNSAVGNKFIEDFTKWAIKTGAAAAK